MPLGLQFHFSVAQGYIMLFAVSAQWICYKAFHKGKEREPRRNREGIAAAAAAVAVAAAAY